jgi:hypothetical protein
MSDTNDLVPASAAVELGKLDTELGKAQTKMTAMLGDAAALKDALTDQSTSYAELTKSIKAYNELEGKAVAVLTDYNKIVGEIEKIKKQVLETESKELKALQEKEKVYKQLLETEAENQKILREKEQLAQKALKAEQNALKAAKDKIKALQDEKKENQGSLPALSEKEKLEQKLAFTQSEEGKAVAKLRYEIQQANREIKNSIRENTNADGSAEKMRATLIRLNMQLDRIKDAVKDKNVATELKKQIEELNADLLKFEANSGRHQRNVGNYASGFNTLGFSVQQVARELPSLTVSFSQFFLAISNNVPMLADQIQKARLEYALMTKAGEKAVPVWKQVASSIFSWQTLLVVGITLITAYGKEIGEWIKGLLKAGKALDDAKIKQEQFGKIAESAGKTLGEQIAVIRTLQSKWGDLADDLDKKKAFIIDNKDEFEKLGVSISKVSEVEEILINSTPAFIEALRARAIAEAARGLSSELYGEAVKKGYKNEQELEKFRNQRDIHFQPVQYGIPIIEYRLPNEKEIEDYKNKLDKTVSDLMKPGDWAFDYSTEQYEKAAKKLKDIDLTPSGSEELIFGTKPYWEKQQKDAQTAIANMNAVLDKGSDDWNKAVEKYNEATEKLKLWDLNNKDAKKAPDEEKKAAQDLVLFLIGEESEKNKRILESNKKSYEERIVALDEFVKTQMESIRKSAEFQLSNEKLTTSGRRLIKEKETAELLKLQQQQEKMQLNITKDYVEEQQKIIETAAKAGQAKIAEDEAAAIRTLGDLYTKGGISYENYEEKKLATIKEYAAKRIDAELESFELLKSIAGLTAEQEEDFERKLQEARVKYVKQANDEIARDYEKSVQDKKKADDKMARDVERAEEEARRKAERARERIKESGMRLAEEMSDFLFQLIDTRYEKQLEDLDRQSEANDEWREGELLRIDEQEQAGVISKENADAQKAFIDAETQRRETELEQKKKEVLQRQAKYEKAQAMISIGISTAQAIMRAYSDAGPVLGIPLAIMVAGIGAVQLAAVAAKPLPEYEHGTDYHKGGPALVGEKRRELVLLPSGDSFITPNKPTIYDLPKGTEVFPDLTNLYAGYAARIPEAKERPVLVQFDASGIINSQNEMRDELRSFKKEVSFNINKLRLNSQYATNLSNSLAALAKR